MIKWFGNKHRLNLSPKDKELRDGYLSLFQSKVSKNTPIENLTFVVLDTETTGLNVKTDTILSVAAIKIINSEVSISDRIEYYVLDSDYSPDQSIEIHGITRNRMNTGEDVNVVMRNIISFVGNGIIVGHHIAFDVKMLDKYVYKLLGFHLKNKTLDTVGLNHRLEHSFPKPMKPISLDDLAKKYGIALGDRHTAATDTFITAIIFLKLLNRLKKRGVDTYGSLIK